MNTGTEIREIMRAAPVIPVITINRLEHAVPLARALTRGGLLALEITLRTPCALAAINAIRDSVKEAIVGAGTLTRASDFTDCLNAGARFAVSPGLTPELVAAAQRTGLPFLPGVMTPSELIAARAAGFQACKLFPAQQAGGIPMLKALAGPFPDHVFCPTGGVTVDNAPDYLALPNVLCVGGSWVAPVKEMEAGQWDHIEALAAVAAKLGG